jgi:hypothetical protein
MKCESFFESPPILIFADKLSAKSFESFKIQNCYFCSDSPTKDILKCYFAEKTKDSLLP